MSKSFLIFVLFSFFLLNKTKAEVITLNENVELNTLHYDKDTSKIIINEYGDTIYLKKRKITAIILTILTGPIGGHRLYLGTKPIVPIVYAVTLGGGFLVIPIMDLFTIIFTRDLSRFENNDKVLMWINGESDDFFEDD